MQKQRYYTMVISCPDRSGIIAAVAGFIAGHGGSIIDANSHHSGGMFFMRQEVDAATLPFGIEDFRARFQHIARDFNMTWRITDSAAIKRLVLLVSKLDHCLVDLLHRWRNKDFLFDIPCVISNHDDLRKYVEWHGIPYHHVPVTKENKTEAYATVCRLFEQYRGDTMVLARYMQVLSEEVCAAYPSRIINIHHSFLPSFAGAKPYHQAHERGVKLVGATCHYVTAELDAGPIIEQDVVRIDHDDSAEDVVQRGKEVERSVLSRGVRYHVEDRVLLHGHKTVVFK